MGWSNRFVSWIKGFFSRSDSTFYDKTDRAAGLWRQLDAVESLTAGFFLFILASAFLYALSHFRPELDGLWEQIRNTLVFFGLLVGLITASAVFGGLLGFLFGIPRILQGAAPVVAAVAGEATASEKAASKTAASSNRFLKGNTNLEEISDWITKIIVGLSLVQAGQIYTALVGAADKFQTQLDGVAHADVAFLTIVISGAIAGFLFFYMETRTRVTMLFGEIEFIQDQRTEIKPAELTDLLGRSLVVPGESASGGRAQGRTDADGRASKANERIIDIPYEELRSGEQLLAWGSAQAQAGNLRDAIRAFRDAVRRDPNNKDALVRLAEVLVRLGDKDEAVRVLTQSQEKTTDNPVLLKRELLTALYLDLPESFQKAIPIAEKLFKRPDTKDDPWVLLWYAAAQAQRFRWLTVQEKLDEAKEARAKALLAVKRLVEVEPNRSNAVRLQLRQLFDPVKEKGDRDDDDLEVFKNDRDFRKLIYGKR